MTGGRPRRAWRFPILAGCAALLACEGTLPPLRGQITVGRESYAIFVGGSTVAGGDLFAVRADGGSVVPITYSNVGESRPALSPDGGAVAFLRGASLRDSMPGSVWVMNLLSGSERELPLPKGAGGPRRVAWSRDGGSLVVEAAARLYLVSAPPASPEPRAAQPAERAAAESSLAVLLGDPVFGEVVPCADPADLCVQADTGSPGLLARDAHDPLRWGPDSVAFFMGDEVEIRPLGPGRARRLSWSNLPRRPRQMTAFVPSPAP